MSIGSETNGGVNGVKVCDLALDGTGNGLRIKSDASRGGLVQNVSYTDVCMRNVKDPFVFDAFYSSATGSLIPNFQNISLHNVHVTGTGSGGSNTFRGYDATHTTTISLDNVILDDPSTATFKDQDTAFSFGPGPVNFMPTATAGTGVTVTQDITGTDAPRDCSTAF
jgi:polygalacturonase